MNKKPTLETQAAFARRIDCVRSYVTELKKDGRLVMEGGKVNVEASLARIRDTGGLGRPDVKDRHSANRKKAAAGHDAPATPPAIPPEEQLLSHKKQEAIAKKAKFDADRAEAEYLQFIGKLVPAESVRMAAMDVGAQFRAMLENLPDQLAPVLAAETDPDRIYALLVEAFEQALTDISLNLSKILEVNDG